MDELTNEQVLKNYRAIKDQMKALEEQEAIFKEAVLQRYQDNIIVSADGVEYKVQIRRTKKIKFADTVSNERLIDILKSRPEIAIEYSLSMKNMWAGLASKLDIIMESNETVVDEIVYPIVQASKTDTPPTQTQPVQSPDPLDDLPF